MPGSMKKVPTAGFGSFLSEASGKNFTVPGSKTLQQLPGLTKLQSAPGSQEIQVSVSMDLAPLQPAGQLYKLEKPPSS